jgi:hypothetical protein
MVSKILYDIESSKYFDTIIYKRFEEKIVQIELGVQIFRAYTRKEIESIFATIISWVRSNRITFEFAGFQLLYFLDEIQPSFFTVLKLKELVLLIVDNKVDIEFNCIKSCFEFLITNSNHLSYRSYFIFIILLTSIKQYQKIKSPNVMFNFNNLYRNIDKTKNCLDVLLSIFLVGFKGKSCKVKTITISTLTCLLNMFPLLFFKIIHNLLPTIVVSIKEETREVVDNSLSLLKLLLTRFPLEAFLPFMGLIIDALCELIPRMRYKFRIKTYVIIDWIFQRCGRKLITSMISSYKNKIPIAFLVENNETRAREIYF